MGMHQEVYIGFGAVVPRHQLTDEFWQDEENERLREGWPDEVYVIAGESEYVFITKDGLYIHVDEDSAEVEDITRLSGSSHKEADEIRAVMRKILKHRAEPRLSTYVYVTVQ